MHPAYRSRLVAKELNDDKTDKLYAPFPPLMAFKYLVSRAATKMKDGKESDQWIYIKRSFLHREIEEIAFI